MTSRSDPRGKRALFETPPVREEDPLDADPLIDVEHPDGRRAVFSTGEHRPGTVVIDCTNCAARTRVSIIDAFVRIAAVSLWIPLKRHSRWLQCPNCQTRSWVRVEWSG